VLGPTERSLIPEEKIADVMSKWERYRTSQNQQNSQRKHVHHFFLFKKHLFLDQYMNLDDPVEKELLYHQVLHDLRADRFPITEKEAVSHRFRNITSLYFLFIISFSFLSYYIFTLFIFSLSFYFISIRLVNIFYNYLMIILITSFIFFLSSFY